MKKPASNNRIRAFGHAIWLACLSCLLTLALLEAVLQLLPVQSYVPYEPVDSRNPVSRYRPCRPFVYSQHWNFQHVNYGRTNAQGFVSAFDYDADEPGPLVAVIGDSYVEARMVNFSDTMQEKIRAGLHGRARVFAFAMNGAALSQYLIFAQLARDTCRPAVLVVTIVSNDFDQSFAAFHSIPRFHYFQEDAGGGLQPRLTRAYRPSLPREMLSHSALVRYLFFHLRITDVPRNLRRFMRTLPRPARSGSTRPASQAHAHTADARRQLSERAADAFLRLLPEYAGLAPDSIVLILDGHRRSLYDDTHGLDAGFEHMRRYVLAHASPMGYEVIDMHPVFSCDYKAHKQRFEFTHDAHWNARAHGLAAREVLASGTLKRLLTGTPRDGGSG